MMMQSRSSPHHNVVVVPPSENTSGKKKMMTSEDRGKEHATFNDEGRLTTQDLMERPSIDRARFFDP